MRFPDFLTWLGIAFALVIVTLLCSCETPTGQRILDKALMLGEKKLDQALGLPPGAVVVPTTVTPIPGGASVSSQK